MRVGKYGEPCLHKDTERQDTWLCKRSLQALLDSKYKVPYQLYLSITSKMVKKSELRFNIHFILCTKRLLLYDIIFQHYFSLFIILSSTKDYFFKQPSTN